MIISHRTCGIAPRNIMLLKMITQENDVADTHKIEREKRNELQPEQRILLPVESLIPLPESALFILPFCPAW